MSVEIDIDHELDSVERKVARAGAEAGERVARTGPVSGEASTADGAVHVRVAPGGLLTELRLTPAALAGGAQALAARILETAGRATRTAGANMHATLAPVLGPEGEKHLASLGYEPAPPEDEDFGQQGVMRR